MSIYSTTTPRYHQNRASTKTQHEITIHTNKQQDTIKRTQHIKNTTHNIQTYANQSSTLTQQKTYKHDQIMHDNRKKQ